MHESIQQCIGLRTTTSEIVANSYPNTQLRSESELADALIREVANLPNVFDGGWYDPPVDGVSVLHSNPQDNFERSRFDTLRNQSYWPSSVQTRGLDSVTIIYVSPVNSNGIIGDWGATLYTGNDLKIRNHLKLCLQIVEELADYSEVGMEYG